MKSESHLQTSTNSSFSSESPEEDSAPEPQLSGKQLEAIAEEEAVLERVITSVEAQIEKTNQKLRHESTRARELTSELVATRRAEDKEMLASDEAVSHAIKDRKKEEAVALEKLIKRPYFARIVVDEMDDRGQTRSFEYKIGFASNLDCRIIDWRKAPLSKLYYQYSEGEEYFEDIQGRERSGVIRKRNRVEIESSQLRKLASSEGNFIKDREGVWHAVSGRSRSLSDSGKSYSRLPDVLSLITPDQFNAITLNAKTAVFIQGIAGSGKTTVALHRLAWLLSPDNSDVNEDEAAIVVLSPALKTYIQNSLPAIQAEAVKVFDYTEWASFCLTGSSLPLPNLSDRPSLTADRVKSSSAMLASLEEKFAELKANGHPISSERLSSLDDFVGVFYELLESIISNPKRFISHDDTRLIDQACLEQTQSSLRAKRTNGLIEISDLPILVRLLLEAKGGTQLPSGFSGLYEHLVVDEVQDLSAMQLGSLVKAVKSPAGLTMVGDISQILSDHSAFPGWDALRRLSRASSNQSTSEAPTESKYLTLEVSFRSTLPIMKLAAHVQGKLKIERGRPGRVPIWFDCPNDERALEMAIDWLNKAQQKYPTALTAVLCRSFPEAKQLYSLLRPTFQDTVSLAQKYSLNLEEGILVSDIEQVKGLEFCNVLIWNPTGRRYHHNNTKERNLLYVAITRAEENLCLVTSDRASRLLPSPRSSLVRHIEVELAEPEGEDQGPIPRFDSPD